MEVGEAVVHEIPELLGGLGSLGTPLEAMTVSNLKSSLAGHRDTHPEPAAFSLVEDTEENGDAGVLEALELDGDSIDITQNEGVVGVGGISKGGGHVEVGGTRVEAAPPGVLVGVVHCSR